MIDLLRRIAREQGVAGVLSSHDLELSLETAHRLLLPGNGRFLDGAPEDIALSGAIGAAFDQHNLRFSLNSRRFETLAANDRRVHMAPVPMRSGWRVPCEDAASSPRKAPQTLRIRSRGRTTATDGDWTTVSTPYRSPT